MNFWEAVQAMKDGKVVTSDKSCLRDASKTVFIWFDEDMWLFLAEDDYDLVWSEYDDDYGERFYLYSFSANEILTETWEVVDGPKPKTGEIE